MGKRTRGNVCSSKAIRTLSRESRKMHIERYSDRKRTMFTRDSLSQVLMFDNFPKELTQGTSKRMASRKFFQWNPEANLEKKLDFFEQKEKRNQGREDEDEDEDEKKDDEDEKKDDEDEDENEESDDDFGGDDYNQGEYRDDDEDDYNEVDEGEDIFQHISLWTRMIISTILCQLLNQHNTIASLTSWRFKLFLGLFLLLGFYLPLFQLAHLHIYSVYLLVNL
uniref:Uncharacterized protein n=1 Tax=Lotus japonicus TaxID=34305 RepID=I3T352_LOTJA|nr:unknown [Lotus japonicus]